MSLPAAHALHVVWLYFAGHVEQSPDVHCAEHAHVQPCSLLPVTEFACPLQLAATVHISEQLG